MTSIGKFLLGIFTLLTALSILATMYKGLVSQDFLVVSESSGD